MSNYHRDPFWQACFQTALGALVSAGAGAPLRSRSAQSRDELEPERPLAALVAGEGGPPVDDWTDADDVPPMTVQDMLVEEAAQLADASVDMLRRRDDELKADRKPPAHYEETHDGGRQPASNIGRVQVLGTPR